MVRVLAALALVMMTVACGHSRPRIAAPTLNTTSTTTPTAEPQSSSTTTSAPTTGVAPRTTTTDAAGPAFVGTVSTVTAADLPFSWRSGCPVDPSQLRALHLSYWGFDGQAHEGTLVVNAAVAQPVIKVFAALYRQRFPIRQMVPIDVYHGDDETSLQADNTAGFNCRAAVAAGPTHWSAHAFGEAIDVNPVENPYIEGSTVHPTNGAAFVKRTPVRPGMAVPGGQLNAAFASAGWQWGGRWTGSPDYQHFSSTGG